MANSENKKLEHLTSLKLSDDEKIFLSIREIEMLAANISTRNEVFIKQAASVAYNISWRANAEEAVQNSAFFLADFKLMTETAKSHLEKAVEIYKKLEVSSDTETLKKAGRMLYKAKTLYQEIKDDFEAANKARATLQDYFDAIHLQDNTKDSIDLNLAYRLGELQEKAISYELIREEDKALNQTATGRFPTTITIPEKNAKAWVGAATPNPIPASAPTTGPTP